MNDQQSRAMRARIAAHESWARTVDRTTRTAAARKAADDRFLAQVPPEVTDPQARREAAESLRKAYYARLAYKSAQARKRKRRAA